MLKESPSEVLEAVIELLLHKLLGLAVSAEIRSLYRDHLSQPDVRHRVRRIRRRRARKSIGPAQGQVFNLASCFDQLNRRYFQGQVRVRQLGWSRRSSRRVLGHYDRALDVIVINRRLDNPLIPKYVVRYVLYHEMLHALLDCEGAGSRRKIHHREFRKRERQFEAYRRACAFIEKELIQ
jgi:hypothetical protein